MWSIFLGGRLSLAYRLLQALRGFQTSVGGGKGAPPTPAPCSTFHRSFYADTAWNNYTASPAPSAQTLLATTSRGRGKGARLAFQCSFFADATGRNVSFRTGYCAGPLLRCGTRGERGRGAGMALRDVLVKHFRKHARDSLILALSAPRCLQRSPLCGACLLY